MTIKVGDKLPSVDLQYMGANGVETVASDDLFAAKKVVLFALPGAFTPTCSASHLPGFVTSADDIQARGIDLIACLSVNDEVVHGIASPDRTLVEGDNIAIDVVVNYQGFIGDNARTVTIGGVSAEMDFLVKSTEEALYHAIDFARPGNRVGDISYAVQRFVESRRLSVVRDFVGHGVGRSMHEKPEIPNFGRKGKGDKLAPGMTLAIEPMVNLGKAGVKFDADGWTARTQDGKPSAHFEHTVLITEDGPEILTISKK